MKFLLSVPVLFTIAAAGLPPPVPPTYAPPSPPPGYGPPPGHLMSHQKPHPFFQFMLMKLMKDGNNGENNNNLHRMMLLQHLFGSGAGTGHGPEGLSHPLIINSLLNNQDGNNGGNSNNDNFQRMMLLQHLFGGGAGMGHGHGGLSHPLIMNSLLNDQCTEPVADCTIPNNNNGIVCGSSPTPQHNDADIKPCCKCTNLSLI